MRRRREPTTYVHCPACRCRIRIPMRAGRYRRKCQGRSCGCAWVVVLPHGAVDHAAEARFETPAKKTTCPDEGGR